MSLWAEEVVELLGEVDGGEAAELGVHDDAAVAAAEADEPVGSAGVVVVVGVDADFDVDGSACGLL